MQGWRQRRRGCADLTREWRDGKESRRLEREVFGCLLKEKGRRGRIFVDREENFISQRKLGGDWGFDLG